MSETSYNILNDFSPEKFNLLIPVQSIQEINPIYRMVVNQVTISTNLDDKEIYQEKGAQRQNGPNMYALTHKALLKLATAANAQIIISERIRPKICEKCIDIVRATKQAPMCGNCQCNANVAFRVVMKFPELSGGWFIREATREIDFSHLTTDKENQIAKMKEFAGEHAESKAMSRCIRKGLNVKNAYSMDELQKPFVVAYPVLDARDADVKKALIAGSLASTNLLYGSGMRHLQLEQAKPENVDTETGEILDPDYEAVSPEAGDEPSKPWDNAEPEKCYCSNPDCKAEIAKSVYDASIKKYGVAACTKCQQQLAKKQGGK